MGGKIARYSATITVSGGSGTVNTTYSNGFGSMETGGYIEKLTITPPSSTSIYNFVIVNPASRNSFKKRNITGTWMSTERIATHGVCTFSIENATVNGSYIIDAEFKEEK